MVFTGKLETMSRDEAKAFFAEKGEDYKIELVDAIPEGEELKIINRLQVFTWRINSRFDRDGISVDVR